ncbi:amidase domain-containing protein [Caminicella sporogenes]|uniref:amidase domain-containing protein n=1 Tax=Caminicella sporogenes TaxID=166485 RepID=UPI002540B12D|nr:amidase domain-containing protein [Caminicella sporogenes]WIF94800.1 amidase domain-containing protein [Caminicella sporogenes]
MIVILSKKKLLIIIVAIFIIIGLFFIFKNNFDLLTLTIFNNDENVSSIIQNIFNMRNEAILKKDIAILKRLYNIKIRYGIWAYEHELKKMKYLHEWSEKQGIVFQKIRALAKVRWVNKTKKGYKVNLIVSTKYKYYYKDKPGEVNEFRIGTYHSIDIERKGENWVITREWYTDPFADSLHIDSLKSSEITQFIMNQNKRDFSNISNRRKRAVKYADRYCGAAADEKYGFKYNKKYKNYNPLGGDCANFASQILYEGGKFKQNNVWKYHKGGSKAWVNAHAFKNYMIYSKRASKIAYGTYEQVYKLSYKLLPGDFIAYEKKGRVIHISVVTGADSRGYAYVHSHNTDRYRVPWDLGWNDRGIKFWLVRVHY